MVAGAALLIVALWRRVEGRRERREGLLVHMRSLRFEMLLKGTIQFIIIVYL